MDVAVVVVIVLFLSVRLKVAGERILDLGSMCISNELAFAFEFDKKTNDIIALKYLFSEEG